MGLHPRSRTAAAGWLVTLPLAGVAAARIARFDRHPFLAMANAGTPFVYLPAYGALAVGLAGGRRALSTVAAAVAVAHVVWTAPELRRARPQPRGAARAGTRLRVVTANVRYPSRDSTALGEELAASDADLLLLQELAPHHLRLIKATGAFDGFPYSYVDARNGSFGAGIWSRYPLSDGDTWEPGGLPMVRATVDVEGTPVRVLNVHCKAPMRRRWIPGWKAQLAALGEEAVEGGPGPLIVAGDFNSTYGHEPFRRLLASGLRDAHVEVGRGLATTWPRGGLVMPPLFRIDHVLVSAGLAVLSVREGRGVGSDHRPVMADLAVVGR
jgi:endonuclease/exonuclease/phosphatase (EEP) superfamily protein YafD